MKVWIVDLILLKDSLALLTRFSINDWLGKVLFLEIVSAYLGWVNIQVRRIIRNVHLLCFLS